MKKLLLLTLSLLLLVPTLDARKRRTGTATGQDVEREVAALYLESVCQRLNGHRDAAFELLTECLRLNPNSVAALYDMANLKLAASALLDSAGVAQGDSLLRRAYALDTVDTSIRDRLAYHLLSRGDYAAATQLYERICAQPRPDYNEMCVLIQLYKMQSQYDRALATVQRLETIESPDDLTAWERFEIYECTGRRDEAFALYDSLLVKVIPDPAASPRVKWGLTNHPRYTEKLQKLRQQLVAAINAGEPVAIRDFCREGEQLDPDFLPYYYYEALSHIQQHDEAAALDACHRGFNSGNREKEDELWSEIYSLAGDIYTSQGNLEAAIDAYEVSVQIDSTRLYTLNNYAYQLSLLNRNLDRAAELSLRTVEADPENATFLDTYAWILYCQRRFKEARTYIDRAEKCADEPDEDITRHRQAIYRALKRGGKK